MTKKTAVCSSAALLCSLAGAAMGQATDGRFTNDAERALYGAAKWVNTTTTGFGDANTNNDPCDPNATGGDPALVTTGVEMKIPLADVGNPTGAVGFSIFINGGGHDYASNQFLPPLPPLSGNLGGDGNGNYNGTVSQINLNNFSGTQHVFATPVAGTAVCDGVRDAGYGAPIAVQNNRTRFGNSTSGTQAANGSELDALYVMQDATHLYVFIAGNMETNFNKIEIFIDSVAGGENTILGDNANIDDNCINNKLAGFTFDTGFSPDYYYTWGIGNGITYYPNQADLNNNTGGFLGCNDAGNGGVLANCGTPPAVEIAMDNTNIVGVDGPCPARGPDVANGSEIDAVYSYVADGRLYVLVTGNLENGGGSACDAGGNKLNVLFDVGSRLDIDRDGDGQPDLDIGQNPMLGVLMENVDIAYGNLNRLGGLRFDDCFVPDYWLSYKVGGDPVYQVVDAAVLRSGGKRVNGIGSAYDYGAYDGGIKADYNPISFRGNFAPCNGNIPDDPQTQTGFSPNIYTNYAPRAAAETIDPGPPVGTPDLILASFDNSNVDGVQGTGGSVSDAVNVSTGFEFNISLAELGWDGESCIKIGGFITSGDVNYGSNQVLGGLPDQNFPNLGTFGNMSTIDFSQIDGDQYVVLAGECDCGVQCPRCAADFNQDGGVDGADVEAFYTVWELGEACGDVNLDGGVDGGDVEAFFAVWENGGC